MPSIRDVVTGQFVSGYATEEERAEANRKKGRDWYARLTSEEKNERIANKRIWRVNNQEQHRAVSAAYARRWRTKNPHRHKTKWLMRDYGITIEQWDKIFAAQEHCCAICKASNPGGRGHWHTDHDHKINKVRQILCHRCNVVLGLIEEDGSILQEMIDYLKKHSGSQNGHLLERDC